jgi:hypothetical protein
MFLEIVFAVSGLMVALLLGAKVWEGRYQRPFFLLSLISRGDERVRGLSHKSAHLYVDIKEKGKFFVEKELPLRTQAFAMKVNGFVKEKYDTFLEEIRGPRFLKRSEGVSEFLKNLSEKEEEGRIDDSLDHPENKQE